MESAGEGHSRTHRSISSAASADIARRRAVLPSKVEILYCCIFLLARVAQCSSAAIAERSRSPATSRSSMTTSQASLDGYPSSLFWPNSIERTLTAPFSERDGKIFAEKARSLRITSLSDGCGRMKNRLATLEDGTRVCCRYRDNINELRGDFYSYQMNAFLGLWNAPPTVAVKVNFSSEQWNGVHNTAKKAGWKDRSIVLLSLYIEDLQGERIPEVLKDRQSPLTASVALSNKSLTMSDKRRLVQWTDMIVFDFVIGHTDRLFNSLLNLKWNPHMMNNEVHNLKKTLSSDLILLDNESGFWIGYTATKQKKENYYFQAFFLEKVCVFRRQTAARLLKLSTSTGSSPSAVLEEYIQQVDPFSFNVLRKLKDQLRTEFSTRLKKVESRLTHCASSTNDVL